MTPSLRHVLQAIGLCALLAAGCKKGETQFRLDNGLRVQLVPSSGDKAALAILFDVGADHDPPDRSGMAQLVNRLFATMDREGKPNRTVQTRTGGSYTFYGLAVPRERLMDEIDDAAARLSTLAPTEADLTREKPRLLEQIASMQEGDPNLAAINRASEALRPSPGGGKRGGIAAEVQPITLAEVDAFRRAHYGASTARLVVAGHFDAAEVTKKIRAAFANVPAATPPRARPDAGSRVTGTLVMGDMPSAFALAVPVPDPKDSLYAAFVVLAARVNGDGNHARAWTGNFAPLARPDTLLVTAAIPKDQQPEAFAEKIRSEVSALVKAPLGADEATKALAMFGNLLGLAPTGEPLETAFAAGRRTQIGFDPKALEQAATKVTAEQVTEGAKLFDKANSAAVVAGGKV